MVADSARKAPENGHKVQDLTTGRRARRLYEDVAVSFVECILGGEFPPGEAVPTDSELTKRFGVSRTVVREAIQALQHCDVFDVRHGAGTYVRPVESWNVLEPTLLAILERTGAIVRLAPELLEVRRAIESEAVSLACRRATANDIERLDDLLCRMKSNEISPETYLELDVRFHAELILASHNVVLRRFAELLSGLLRVLMATMGKYGEDRVNIVASTAGHELILRAIKHRDPERARAALLAHIQNLEDWAPQFLDGRGVSGSASGPGREHEPGSA